MSYKPNSFQSMNFITILIKRKLRNKYFSLSFKIYTFNITEKNYKNLFF